MKRAVRYSYNIFRLSPSAQSEEARTRKRVATLDERFETLSQKLSREFTIILPKWHVPRMPPQAIERIGLSNGLSSKFSNTANLAARAIQRLPI
jgi:hypothetical protein